MTGRGHLHAVGPHGLIDDDQPEPDDPGPVTGSLPVCPVCGTGQPPDLEAVDKPPGYLCRRCGLWVPPQGGRLTDKQRQLWNEAHRPSEPVEPEPRVITRGET